MDSINYFNINGYVVLKDVIEASACAELSKYMHTLYEQGSLSKDSQCPLSDSIYGNPVFDKLLVDLATPIGENVGKQLIPTYSYARIYRNGEVLEKHKDRSACEISATLTLGFDAKSIWPIFFDENSEIKIELDVGEMAVYKGCDLTHWRPKFKGEWHIQVFFHYVDANGPYKDEAIDKRGQYGFDKKTDQSILDNIFPGYVCINQDHNPDLMFTKDECLKIISLSNEIYEDEASIGSCIEELQINKSIRSANIFDINHSDETNWIYKKIIDIVETINQRYFDYELSGIRNSLQLIQYSANNSGHYDWHIDCGTNESATRKISFSLQLSDPKDYQGGDLIINDNGTIVTAPKDQGSVHLFPSYQTHKVNPVTSGERFALVIWIHGLKRFK